MNESLSARLRQIATQVDPRDAQDLHEAADALERLTPTAEDRASAAHLVNVAHEQGMHHTAALLRKYVLQEPQE